MQVVPSLFLSSYGIENHMHSFALIYELDQFKLKSNAIFDTNCISFDNTFYAATNAATNILTVATSLDL